MVNEAKMCAECSMNCSLYHKKKYGNSPMVSSFFKVMFGKQFSKVLFVPPSFSRTFTSLVGKNTYLEDTNGRKWHVVLSNVNGSLALQQGWQEFALEHDIKMGDFVVFHYFMESHFVVQIYGTSGCEKSTSSGQQSYHNKRIKTTRDSVARNDPYNPFYDEPSLEEHFTACAVSVPNVDATQRHSDVHMTQNVQRPENITQRPKVAPATDYLVDPCLLINRDTNFSRQDDKEHLFDLSIFEMPAKKLCTDKTSKLQPHENIQDSEVSAILPNIETGAVSIDMKKCHIAEKSTLSKYEEAFMSRKEYTPPSSSCLKVDTPFSSHMPQLPIRMPLKSEFLATSGEKTAIVKQEPLEPPQEFVGNDVADTSLGISWCNANLSMVKTNDEELCENLNCMVKDNDDIHVVVKPEPVDLCDSSSAPVPDIKITCSVQPNRDSFLELPERLPMKAYRPGARLEKLVFLQDPAKRLWPVVYHQRSGVNVLASGWKAFREANNIQPGDECAFVIADMNEGIFSVQVCRS